LSAFAALFHFDSESLSHVLENNFHRLNNPQLRMGLAIHNDLMLGFFSFSNIHVVLFCQPVVPTAVPNGEPIGVTLPRVGELSASQGLNVNIPVGISISIEIDLGLSRGTRQRNAGGN
jgi:hypothetical protein